MKCPKCGYTSFDYLDSCKKCNHGLTEFKTRFGLRSLLFPNRSNQAVASVAAVTAAAVPASAASGNLDFDRDFMGDGPTQATAPSVRAPASAGDGFDFDSDWDESPPRPPVPQPPAQAEGFDFDTDWDAAPAATAAVAAADAFDLRAETPEPPAKAGEENQDLHFGVEEVPLPVAAVDSEFAFDPGWDEAAAPAAAGSPADGLRFADASPADELSFDDEFDFSDEGLPDQLAAGGPFPSGGRKPGAQEGPPDPFELRESAPAGPAPAATVSETVESPVPAIDHSPPTAAPADAPADPAAASAPAQGLVSRVLESGGDAPTVLEVDAEPELSEADPAEASPAPPAGPAGTPFFRLGAGALDTLLLALIFALFLAAGKLALFPADQAVSQLPFAALADLAIPYFLILFALCFGYFTLFHFLSGQTPGKMLFRLKVESVSGDGLQFAQAFLRSVGGLLSLVCGGLGYLLMLRDPQYRGWNDLLAGTRVVTTTALPPGE